MHSQHLVKYLDTKSTRSERSNKILFTTSKYSNWQHEATSKLHVILQDIVMNTLVTCTTF